MRFKNQLEMYKALVEGKKIHGLNWDKGEYIHFVNGFLVSEDDFSLYDMDGTRHTHMQLYKEPKKKVKMAPVLARLYGGELIISLTVYSSEQEARASCSDTFFIKWLIDTPYAIEVEVDE